MVDNRCTDENTLGKFINNLQGLSGKVLQAFIGHDGIDGIIFYILKLLISSLGQLFYSLKGGQSAAVHVEITRRYLLDTRKTDFNDIIKLRQMNESKIDDQIEILSQYYFKIFVARKEVTPVKSKQEKQQKPQVQIQTTVDEKQKAIAKKGNVGARRVQRTGKSEKKENFKKEPKEAIINNQIGNKSSMFSIDMEK